VKTSSVLLQAIIEKQANVVTASNCGSFLESKSRAGLVLLGHPDSAVVAGMLDWFVIFGDAHMKLGEHEEAVLQCLSHPQKASSAARLLVQTGAHDDFVPDLINAWEMSDLENRSALMKAIGSIYDARLLPVILEGIQYPEQSVMKSAEQALERYATFREQKSTLQAWQEAGRKGDPEEFLIKKLESNDPKVRLAAIESLGTMHAKVALPFLVDLLEDTNADIAKASAVALKKINAASPKGDKRDKD
jgi:hypothetical protein